MTKIITTVSPVLAALFVANDAARATLLDHQRDVLEAPAFESLSPEERRQKTKDSDALLDELCKVHYAIAGHPVETARDLNAKLTFMIDEQMGDGQDWLPTILEDVERIEPAETPEWSAALAFYEQTTADNEASLDALNAAEAARHEDGHEEAVRAQIAAEVRHDETTEAQCAAIRALTNAPAPSLSALLVNMQIAIDTGMIACGDIGHALKTDLRRFSHYADREA